MSEWVSERVCVGGGGDCDCDACGVRNGMVTCDKSCGYCVGFTSMELRYSAPLPNAYYCYNSCCIHAHNRKSCKKDSSPIPPSSIIE